MWGMVGGRRTSLMRRSIMLVVAALAATGLCLIGTPAYAFANAFFPTQSTGNRGVDVQAIQHLLNHHGYAVDPMGWGWGPPPPPQGGGGGENAVFGTQTNTAVRAFQTDHGLGVDGIVGPATWTALVPLLRQGDSGSAVRALQVELNEKRRIPLGDTGFEHGGDIPGHASHEVGLDVDIWPIRTDNAQCTAGRITWQS